MKNISSGVHRTVTVTRTTRSYKNVKVVSIFRKNATIPSTYLDALFAEQMELFFIYLLIFSVDSRKEICNRLTAKRIRILIFHSPYLACVRNELEPNRLYDAHYSE